MTCGTRPSPSRDASRLVLVEGYGIAEAAAATGVTYNALYQAIKARRQAIALARELVSGSSAT